MLWAYAALGGVGLLVGLRYRAPALIVASGLTTVGSFIVATLYEWSILQALAAAFGGLTALQCGYLAGLLLTCAASRLPPRTMRRKLPS
ncbi:MAG: hypothetical protein K2X43_10585 [Hyphomonadaceae bacterium]|jgi:hypothetical protein|nr:hypothetical protein [Hyphomonadaceae bacterium]